MRVRTLMLAVAALAASASFVGPAAQADWYRRGPPPRSFYGARPYVYGARPFVPRPYVYGYGYRPYVAPPPFYLGPPPAYLGPPPAYLGPPPVLVRTAGHRLCPAAVLSVLISGPC